MRVVYTAGYRHRQQCIVVLRLTRRGHTVGEVQDRETYSIGRDTLARAFLQHAASSETCTRQRICPPNTPARGGALMGHVVHAQAIKGFRVLCTFWLLCACCLPHCWVASLVVTDNTINYKARQHDTRKVEGCQHDTREGLEGVSMTREGLEGVIARES